MILDRVGRSAIDGPPEEAPAVTLRLRRGFPFRADPLFATWRGAWQGRVARSLRGECIQWKADEENVSCAVWGDVLCAEYLVWVALAHRDLAILDLGPARPDGLGRSGNCQPGAAVVTKPEHNPSPQEVADLAQKRAFGVIAIIGGLVALFFGVGCFWVDTEASTGICLFVLILGLIIPGAGVHILLFPDKWKAGGLLDGGGGNGGNGGGNGG